MEGVLIQPPRLEVRGLPVPLRVSIPLPRAGNLNVSQQRCGYWSEHDSAWTYDGVLQGVRTAADGARLGVHTQNF